MRILRVRILNLNSLLGEHVIDFTSAPLASHQLYAIVGPTGAGKTTILDAITLALYGITERGRGDNNANKDNKTVMSYGTGECEAAVEYETAAGRYRSTWTQARARKKPTGNLQDSKHRIERLDPGGVDPDKILAEKKREVEVKTTEVIGLDYERFVRSAMLTQGEFARFLKSNAREKADILEKITGTAIYGELSKAAFDRHKLAREAFEEKEKFLTFHPPLPEEERRALEQTNSEKERESARLGAELKAANHSLAAYEELAKLEERLTKLSATHRATEEEWLELGPERHQLANAVAVAHLRPTFDQLDHLRQQKSALAIRLATLQGEYAKQLQGKTSLEKQHADANREVNDFAAAKPERERQCQVAATLEKEIDQLTTRSQLLREQLGKLEVERQGAAKLHQESSVRILQLRESFEGRSAEVIDANVEELEDKVDQLRKKEQFLRRWQEITKLANAIAAELTREVELRQAIAAAIEERAVVDDQLKVAKAELEERLIVFKAYQLQYSLREHQASLIDGEPCPVCGATDHPVLKGFTTVTDEQISAVESRVETARQTVSELEKRLTALRVRKDADTDRLRAIERRRQESERQLDLLPRPGMAVDLRGEQFEEALSGLDSELQAQITALAAAKQLQKNLPALRQLETDQATREKQMALLTTQTAELADKVREDEATVGRKKEEVEKLLGGKYTADQCTRLLHTQEAKLLAAKNAADASLIKARANLEASVANLTVAKDLVQANEERLSTLAGKLTPLLLELELSEDQARSHLLPVSSEQRLREQLVATERRKDLIENELKSLTATLQQQRTAVAELPAASALATQAADLTEAVAAAQRARGAVAEQLRQDDLRINAIAEAKEEMEHLRKERNRWARLDDLIGSASGKKFQGYAQAITLQRLIEIGNDHLTQIAPRYRMEYEAPEPGGKEELNMIIIDQYQNDNRRTMATLSGGESFLISLALALGLSDLASGKSLIQSLFIDEGFGTLDGKTLDQAMTTLEGLQAQGKTIGLISHVPALKERIPCRIVVEPVGEGFSTLRFTG